MMEINYNDIVINVYRSLMTYNRYTVIAKYKNNDKICGVGYVENDFISKLRGRSLQDEIKLATCEAIKDLKNNYNSWVNEKEHMTFIHDQAQSYVNSCLEIHHEGK